MLIYKTAWIGENESEIEGPEGTLAYMLKCEMLTQEQVAGMKVGETITVDAAYATYPLLRVTMEDVESYTCNCCDTEQPGDGCYDICHNCGWENGLSEKYYPDLDCGPNHMSLNEARANFKTLGWYREGVKII